MRRKVRADQRARRVTQKAHRRLIADHDSTFGIVEHRRLRMVAKQTGNAGLMLDELGQKKLRLAFALSSHAVFHFCGSTAASTYESRHGVAGSGLALASSSDHEVKFLTVPGYPLRCRYSESFAGPKTARQEFVKDCNALCSA